MKIASMVPSWTETLIECGANVVARTRFCIHPQSHLKAIPAVGGTKDIDWDKLRATSAEILLLDREENPRAMAESSPLPWIDTNVVSVSDVPRELRKIAGLCGGDFSCVSPPSLSVPGSMPESASGSITSFRDRSRANATLRSVTGFADGSICPIDRDHASDQQAANGLRALADRWDRALALATGTTQERRRRPSWAELPGVQEWLHKPDGFYDPLSEKSNFIYMIWRDPWMAAAPQTFIGSVLSTLGFGAHQLAAGQRYPVLELSDLDPARTVLLFSSEPFPFHRQKAKLAELGFAAAIVDGEAFSWFGLRSLQFLERAQLQIDR